MQKSLLLYILLELAENSLLDMLEHASFIAALTMSHRAYNLFKHQNILNFSYIRHKYFLITQIFNLFRITTVAIDYAMTVKMMKRT